MADDIIAALMSRSGDGAERPAATGDTCACSNCGWKSSSGQGSPKFCPECGKSFT